MIGRCLLVMFVVAILIFVVVSLLYTETYTYRIYVNGNLYHCNAYEYTADRLTLSDCRGYSEPIVFLYPANLVIKEK